MYSKSNKNPGQLLAAWLIGSGAFEFTHILHSHRALGCSCPFKHTTPLTLCEPERHLTTAASIASEIQASGTKYDGVIATSHEGNFWGVMVADTLGIPFYIVENSVVYKLVPRHLQVAQRSLLKNCDGIAATKFGIGDAVRYSMDTELPVIIIRERSSQSLENRIGGSYSKMHRVYFIDEHPIDGGVNAFEYVTALSHVGLEHTFSTGKSVFERTDLNGQNLLVMEGFVTKGAKTVTTAETIRSLGGAVTDAYCMFNFGLAESRTAFKHAGITMHSLTGFDDLVGAAVAQRKILDERGEILKLWKDDPTHWHKQHIVAPYLQ